MALLDPASRRSATVISKGEVVLLRVTEPIFSEISSDYPAVWKPLARVLAERLRQRAQFHRPSNPEPVLFIGSSVAGLPVGREIHAGLMHQKITPIIWPCDVFGPLSDSIDALLKVVAEADFAALVFGPDDKVMGRDGEQMAPRDNVVFELGLFIGGLGRERSFIVKEHKADIKIPTDLMEITPITYVIYDVNRLPNDVNPVCTKILKAINALGVR